MPMTKIMIDTRRPSRDAIAKRAHEIYCARGSRPGQEKDDWLQAEYELLQLPLREIAALPTPGPVTGKKAKAAAMGASALILLVQSALLLGSSSIQ